MRAIPVGNSLKGIRHDWNALGDKKSDQLFMERKNELVTVIMIYLIPIMNSFKAPNRSLIRI